MTLRESIRKWLYGPTLTTTFRGAGAGLPFVTASNALQFTPIYRAVTVIATDIARLECEISSSEADSLFRNPSPYINAFDFRRAMTMNVLLYGNAFAVINRTQGGELAELIMLDPSSVSLDIVGPRPYYRTTAYGIVNADSMFHLRAPGLSGIWGESPIELCRTSIQLLGAQENMALRAYQNAGNPKIAIIHPSKLSAEAIAKIEADYLRYHSGSDNAGRPFIGMDNIRIERISSTIDDTGLAQARAFSIDDVSRIYGVPGHMLGQASSGNAYGSLEWMGRSYSDSCLAGWIACWAAEIQAKLCAPGETVYFDTDDVARPSMAEMYAALRTGVESGIITRNEAREMVDMPPLAGLDAPIVAKNMGLGGGTTNIGTDTSAEAGTVNDF